MLYTDSPTALCTAASEVLFAVLTPRSSQVVPKMSILSQRQFKSVHCVATAVTTLFCKHIDALNVHRSVMVLYVCK